MPDVVHVGGFDTARVTRAGLAQMMCEDCRTARQRGDDWLPRLVFSSNGQGIALAGRDSRFDQHMSTADIIHADGMSVVFASRLTRTPLPERISTTDFFHDAAKLAQDAGLTFYLLGGTETQNERAVARTRALYPRLRIVGSQHGFFGPDEDEAVCAKVREAAPDVLWVGLGKPRQEEWAVRNRSRLQGIGWIKTCGGLYAFLAGDAQRAPHWMQAAGLEWAYRIMDDPKRLIWRYLSTNPYALFRLLTKTQY